MVLIELDSCAAAEQCAERYVEDRELHRPGLALAGYLKLFSYQRIQILGNTECEYLSNMTAAERQERFFSHFRLYNSVIFSYERE